MRVQKACLLIRHDVDIKLHNEWSIDSEIIRWDTHSQGHRIVNRHSSVVRCIPALYSEVLRFEP
jgi:hypothetical protein